MYDDEQPLVVVLIIGILAAIALPQYEKAVAKSRLTQAVALMPSYRQAIEAYIMENGGSHGLTFGNTIGAKKSIEDNLSIKTPTGDNYYIYAYCQDNNTCGIEISTIKEGNKWAVKVRNIFDVRTKKWTQYNCEYATGTKGQQWCKLLEPQGYSVACINCSNMID